MIPNTMIAQQAYLKARDTLYTGDSFGSSVAISGNTIVVGVPFEKSDARGVNNDIEGNRTPNSYGAAYVFVNEASGWRQGERSKRCKIKLVLMVIIGMV